MRGRRAGAAGAAGGRRPWHASICGTVDAAADMLGDGQALPTVGAGGLGHGGQAWAGASVAARCGRARAGGRARAIFTWLCHATDQGASLPRQDRWRGRPYHVTGQCPGHRHVIPLAAPPCMMQHGRFAAPGK